MRLRRHLVSEQEVSPDDANDTEGDGEHDGDRLEVTAEQPGEDDVDQHSRGGKPDGKRGEGFGHLALCAAQLDAESGELDLEAIELRLKRGQD